jgi:uncharacterized protein YbjT (DUF2867 family)
MRTRDLVRRHLLIGAAMLLLGSAVAPVVAAETLLVIGATGGTGREVVRQAEARGLKVRAFVRDEARARATLGERIEYVEGDVRSGTGIDVAMHGVDYVVSALGSNVRADAQNTPEKVDYEGIRKLAETAARAGVRHFVLVSSMGVTHEDHPLNKMFGNILVWKLKGENALRASGIPYTVVRPGGLLDTAGGATGVKVFQGDDLRNQGRIARADVATVCLAALGNAAAINKTFELVADESAASSDLKTIFAGLKSDAR